MPTQLLEKPITKQRPHYLPVGQQTLAKMPVFRLPDEFYPLSRDGWAVSEETYWAEYYEGSGDVDYDTRYEWNNGYLEELGVSNYQVHAMADWLQLALNQYLASHPIGKLVSGGDFGFRLKLANKVAIRKPDFAIVLNNNWQKLAKKDRSYHGTFDLCIEALSDSTKRDVERDTIDKKKDYAEVKIREYYIIDDEDRMAFYSLNQFGQYEPIAPIAGDIICSKVLPGFQFRKSDLLRQPTLEEMAEDEVYRGYVLPLFQAQKQELAKERQRAELLAAKLRELGINPDALSS